jgi:hypothetical protein
MEVICDESLWIWHAFFGCPGSYNDINILNCSPLFSAVLAGNFPPAAPAVDIEGFKLEWFYWLVDGIYPRWSRFVSTFRDPKKPEEHDFNDRQEAVRKSVERVFGVLFKRFNILYQPSRLHHVETMRSVVLACVILHNMIVEVRRDGSASLRSAKLENESVTPTRTAREREMEEFCAYIKLVRT